MTNITLKDAIRYAKEAAAEKPEDYVYTNPDGQIAGVEEDISCSYWDVNEDAPSCLVGHVLHRAGVENDGWHASGLWFGSLMNLYSAIEIDEDAWIFLSAVQTNQDRGVPWNKAILIGEERVKNL